MLKKFLISLSVVIMLICSTFTLTGCFSEDREPSIEEAWLNEGAWAQVYVYEGKGKIIQMFWDRYELVGGAFFDDTEESSTEIYCQQYKEDPNYKSATLGFVSDPNRAMAFQTLDGKIYIKITWTSSSTSLVIKMPNGA